MTVEGILRHTRMTVIVAAAVTRELDTALSLLSRVRGDARDTNLRPEWRAGLEALLSAAEARR